MTETSKKTTGFQNELVPKNSVNRIIGSLSFIKLCMDEDRKDYLDYFIPFIATLINKNKYKKIETNKIRQDFKSEFGLNIPYHAMITILDRARKDEIIRKNPQNGEYISDESKVCEKDFSYISKSQIERFDKLIISFLDFAAIYGVVITKADAEKVFLKFLSEYNTDLFTAEKIITNPVLKDFDKYRFFLNKFIKQSHDKNDGNFQILLDLAIGYTFASTLLFSEIDTFKGSINSVNYYLDTNFIFRILGVEGAERKGNSIELIKALLEEKANLLVFEHTYEELKGILFDCQLWINNPDYDPSLASNALKYFTSKKFTPADIGGFITNIPFIFNEYGIQIIDTPNLNIENEYNIDVEKLYDIIIKTYKSNSMAFNKDQKNYTIQQDIKSIASIYKLRKGIIPLNIQDAKHILLTTNSALSYADQKYYRLFHNRNAIIPASLTDVFIGTIIWLQKPAKFEIINEKKLIADCYASLQPNYLLIQKFSKYIEQLKTEKKLSPNQCYYLRTHNMVMSLLQEKTMGDPNRFDEKTFQEIFNEVSNSILSSEDEIVFQKIKNDAKKTAIIISNVVQVFLTLIYISGVIAAIIPDIIPDPYWRMIIRVFTAILTISSSIFLYNIKKIRESLVSYLTRLIMASKKKRYYSFHSHRTINL